MTLREEIRKLAMGAAASHEWEPTVESAILAGIKLVLEREPSAGMIIAASEYRNAAIKQDEPWTSHGTYRAMTAQLLKELE